VPLRGTDELAIGGPDRLETVLRFPSKSEGGSSTRAVLVLHPVDVGAPAAGARSRGAMTIWVADARPLPRGAAGHVGEPLGPGVAVPRPGGARVERAIDRNARGAHRIDVTPVWRAGRTWVLGGGPADAPRRFHSPGAADPAHRPVLVLEGP